MDDWWKNRDLQLVTDYFRSSRERGAGKTAKLPRTVVDFLFPQLTVLPKLQRETLQEWIVERTAKPSTGFSWSDGRSLRAFIRNCDKIGETNGVIWKGPISWTYGDQEDSTTQILRTTFTPYYARHPERHQNFLSKNKACCKSHAMRDWIGYIETYHSSKSELVRLLEGYVE